MRLIRNLLLITILTLFALPKKTYADGFPLRPGRLLASAGYNYFYADQLWDKGGVKSAFPLNGSYTSNSFNIYLEYGLSRKFTLFTSVPYLTISAKNSASTTNVSGLGDAETGIRYYLFNINYKYYFSIQASVTTPLYQGQDIGYNQLGGELRASVAGTGKVFGTFYYLNLENGVRQFFDSNGPVQDRYTGSFGLALDKKGHNLVTVGLAGVYSSSDFKGFSENLLLNRDYRFTQATLSYGHTFDRLTLLLSGNQFITGRNTGDGYGGGLAVIYKIDTR